VFLAGGVLALLYITARLVTGHGGSLRGSQRRIPYGIAIAVGALFIFVTQLNQRPSDPILDRLRAAQAAQK
jgi:Flp pilus assembly protein protease CpaA